jgi:hypothetical protein
MTPWGILTHFVRTFQVKTTHRFSILEGVKGQPEQGLVADIPQNFPLVPLN